MQREDEIAFHRTIFPSLRVKVKGRLKISVMDT